MKTQILSTRLDKKHSQEIDLMAKDNNLDRSSFIKHLLLKGLHEYKIQSALSRYNKNEITLSKAAEITGVSLYDIISLIEKHKIELNFSIDDLEHDIEAIEKK